MRYNVKIWKNGNLIDKGHNNLDAELKSYLIGLTDVPTTDKVLDSMFQDDEELYGGTEDGNDGIIVDVDGSYRTMGSTTFETPTNTYAIKVRAEYTNTSGAQVSLTSFILGHNFNTSNNFETRYASYNPTAINLDDQDTLVLQWEVYVSS